MSMRSPGFKAVGWMKEHTHCTKEAWAAWVLVSVSWGLRGTAVFLLLNALALGSSFPLALAFVCATAASAALPIGPAGAGHEATFAFRVATPYPTAHVASFPNPPAPSSAYQSFVSAP